MTAMLYPYKAGSESAKALSDALGIKRIAHKASKFVGGKDKLIINWGASEVPDEVAKCKILNPPEAVKRASNKLLTFSTVDMYRVMPVYTTDKAIAAEFIRAGRIIVERHKLTGNSGEGIRIVESVDDLQDCPLYVEYIPKKQEYRVHVFRGSAVDIQRKARRRDVPDDKVNWRIRNHDNGFIFARQEAVGDVPTKVLDYAIFAVRKLGLDFGAVDIVFNEKQNRPYVLEVNTAPGMTGETLGGYKLRFSRVIDQFEASLVAKPKAPKPFDFTPGAVEWITEDDAVAAPLEMPRAPIPPLEALRRRRT